jgi:hypothetical protein
MAATLPNMGLKQWNLATDTFSYSELSTNINLIDQHDHSSGKGVQIPSGGIANGAVTLAKLATNSVDATKILDASVSDAELASANNSVYRTVFTANALVASPTTGSIYLLQNASNIATSGTGAQNPVSVHHLAAASYAVTNLTARLRLKATVLTNATSPAATYTFGLYPISSVAGTATNIQYNAGTVVGNTVVLTPTASQRINGTSTDFTFPADDYYAIGFTNNATPAAGSVTSISVALQLRHT